MDTASSMFVTGVDSWVIPGVSASRCSLVDNGVFEGDVMIVYFVSVSIDAREKLATTGINNNKRTQDGFILHFIFCQGLQPCNEHNSVPLRLLHMFKDILDQIVYCI